jgi:hypothetical protein
MGVRRMTVWLRQQGYAVNPKRVARLLHAMGLETIYPNPRMTQPHPERRVYPYLLRGVPITRVNQVWSTDITYIRLIFPPNLDAIFRLSYDRSGAWQGVSLMVCLSTSPGLGETPARLEESGFAGHQGGAGA